jgi:hypothetical protein
LRALCPIFLRLVFESTDKSSKAFGCKLAVLFLA